MSGLVRGDSRSFAAIYHHLLIPNSGNKGSQEGEVLASSRDGPHKEEKKKTKSSGTGATPLVQLVVEYKAESQEARRS